jgi:putative membrane protein
MSAFFLGYVDLPTLAGVLTAGTLLSVASTLAFAVAESRTRRARGAEA